MMPDRDDGTLDFNYSEDEEVIFNHTMKIEFPYSIYCHWFRLRPYDWVAPLIRCNVEDHQFELKSGQLERIQAPVLCALFYYLLTPFHRIWIRVAWALWKKEWV